MTSAARSPVARRETRAHIDKYRWMRISPWKEAWFARSVAALREQREVSGFRGGRPAIRKLETRPDRRDRYSVKGDELKQRIMNSRDTECSLAGKGRFGESESRGASSSYLGFAVSR